VSQEKIVDLTKALVTTSHEVVAAESDPFDQVSGTPALDDLKLNGVTLSDEELTELIAKVEAAKTDPEVWKTVAESVGAMLKILMLALGLLLMVGCATPAEVHQAMDAEAKAFGVFKSDHDIIVRAYHDDLKLALDRQIDLILKYELLAAGADEAKKAALIQGATTKRTEIQAQLEAHIKRIIQADGNYAIAMKIHAAVAQYMAKELDAAAMSGAAETGLEAVQAVMAD